VFDLTKCLLQKVAVLSISSVVVWLSTVLKYWKWEHKPAIREGWRLKKELLEVPGEHEVIVQVACKCVRFRDDWNPATRHDSPFFVGVDVTNN